MKYLAITAILCLILAGASFAGNVIMTEVITGGNLTLTMPSNFSFNNQILGGSASFDLVNTNPTYYVEDSRGTGVGWNLGFAISQFTTSGTPTKTIPVANFYMLLYNGNITTDWGQANNYDYGPASLYITYFNLQSNETKLVTATTGYGMGKYHMNPYNKLTIPAATYAGTYTATLTATLNNTP